MRGAQFSELAAFAAVAEQRGFAKAAVRLGVSKSSLSHALRSLEERLGVRLLNRTTRSVAPTEAGERLLARLRPAMDDLDAALEAVNAFRDRPAGRLRLTVAPPAIDMVIAPALPRFLAENPEVSVEVVADGGLADIVAGRFDAGIRPGERVEQDMVAVRVSDPLDALVFGSPAYFARRGRPEAPEDLRGHDCIRIGLPSGATLPWAFERDGERFEIAVTGSLTVNHEGLAIRAAMDGLGLCLFPDAMLAGPIASGALEPVLAEFAAKADSLFLYYSSRRHTPAPLRAFIDRLQEDLKARRRAG